MRDVFYFTKASVNLADIASSVHAIGRNAEIIETSDGQILNICGPSDELLHCIPIEPLGKDFSSYELPEQERLLAYQPLSGFIISFHLTSGSTLISLLKHVLNRNGGWIGSDSDAFEPSYEINNLDDLFK